MMEWAKNTLEKVELSRKERLHQLAPIPTETEAESILNNFHPDYSGKERTIVVGPNAGNQKFPLELANLLEADSFLPTSHNTATDIETDVLILVGFQKVNTSKNLKKLLAEALVLATQFQLQTVPQLYSLRL